MSTASTIADYIRHNRSLGKRFVAEAAILSAFSRSVGKMPLLDIRPAMITRFVNREGSSDETIAKKHRALAGFFRYAVTRRRLKTSPMPSFVRRRGGGPSFTPYIYSEAELTAAAKYLPALKSLSGMKWSSRPAGTLGKADVAGEETGKRTLSATVVGVQASEERFAEITSGRA